MITCLGLIVCLVDLVENTRQDMLNQCAKFLKRYPYLLKCGTEFMIDHMVFATVIDTHEEDNDVTILCRIYDGSIKIGTSAN